MAEQKKNRTTTASKKTSESVIKNTSTKTSSNQRKSSKNQKSKTKQPALNISFKGILFILIVAIIGLICLYFFNKPLFNEIKNKVFEPQKVEAQAENDLQNDSSLQNSVSSAQFGTENKNLPKFFWKSQENDPMFFGNPSGAILFNEQNIPLETSEDAKSIIFVKPQFTLSYNAQKLIPNWVMWHLSKDDFGGAERGDDFRPDDSLPSSWYAVKKADYQYKKYGFDRGHVCPSADRTKTQTDNSNTFYMTNMIPQAPDCNRVLWKDLESYERRLAEQGHELYIAAGPYGTGGQSSTGEWNSIVLTSKNNNGAAREIEVPAYCWKVILVLEEGSNDFSRVTKDTPVIAVYMPNRQGIAIINDKKVGWNEYLTTVDFIEEKTKYDFFANLPDDIEDAIESKVFKMISVQ